MKHGKITPGASGAELSEHGRRLIIELARLPRDWQTAATLAEAIGVSRRTVQRELPAVERWLTAGGFQFTRVPGQGLLLDEDEQARSDICRRLSADSKTILSPDDRRMKLLELLLSAEEPQKTYALAYDLGVSEHILSGDLDWAAEWLNAYRVTVQRKPGVGIMLRGEASFRRAAAAALLRSRMLTRDTAIHFSRLADHTLVTQIPKVLLAFEQEEDLRFSDTGFLNLSVHCLLTVQQLREQRGNTENNNIKNAETKNSGRKHAGTELEIPYADSVRSAHDIYNINNIHPVSLEQARRLAQRLKDAFQVELPPEEMQHLARYFSANDRQSPKTPVSAEELNVRGIAVALIDEVGKILGVDLSQYPHLTQDLSVHIQPMLYRMERGETVDNPQMEFVQTQYQALWQAVRRACEHISQRFTLPPVSDEEAVYLAMHIGAALESDALAQKRVQAVVVCPYGMASSKFLAVQLRREFPILHIADCCSVRDLNPENLRRRGIDLIITTIQTDIPFPVVRVSMPLLDSDRARLKAATAEKALSAPTTRAAKVWQSDTLTYARQLSGILIDLLDHLTIQNVRLPENRNSFIHAASMLFCENKTGQQSIEAALTRREALGNTYVKPLWALLLHCRSNAISGCRLGYLQASPPIYEKKHSIRGALVLLAGESAAEENTADLNISVARTISELLIEHPELMHYFREGNLKQLRADLERELSQRFHLELDKHKNL